MAFDPNNPALWFQNMNNLSPDYSHDAPTAQQHAKDMTDALAWLKANPNTPNADYFIQTLNSSLPEQQDLITYLGDQLKSTDASNNLNTYIGIKNYYSGKDGFNQFTQWLRDTGKIPANTGPVDKDSQYGLGPVVTKMYNDQMSQWDGLIKTYQDQVNASNTSTLADKTKTISGFTTAQPNYDQERKTLNDYYEKTIGSNGKLGSVTLPQTQSIYATAYQAKKMAGEQLNANGGMSGGAEEKAKGNIDSQALSRSLENLSTQENEAAKNKSNLESEISGQKASYANLVNGVMGNEGAKIFSGGANDMIGTYNQNTMAQAKDRINNTESEIAQKAANDRFLQGIFGTIGSAAGTAAGALI